VAVANAKNGKRGPEAIMFGIFLPLIYMIVGIVLSSVFSGGASEGDIISPDPFYLTPSLLFRTDAKTETVGVFGIGSGQSTMDVDGVSVHFNASVLSTPEQFVDVASQAGFLLVGGLLTNSTLMYDAGFSHAFPILQALLLNETLSEQLSDATFGVNLIVDPLPYIKEAGFNINALIVPICLNLGFFPLAFIVIDLVLLREYKIFEILHVMGVERFTSHVGVFLTTLSTSFLLFATIAFVLCLAVGSPAAGNGGRWFALLMVLITYAFAAPGFAMLFAPLFKTLKGAKDGMPPLW
jgi:hypothetical protein